MRTLTNAVLIGRRTLGAGSPWAGVRTAIFTALPFFAALAIASNASAQQPGPFGPQPPPSGAGAQPSPFGPQPQPQPPGAFGPQPGAQPPGAFGPQPGAQPPGAFGPQPPPGSQPAPGQFG